ncbi:MAG: aminoacyl-tRNA hydrolase [Nitrospirae bacterium]|jgi:peptidyl-tRNA hydrolase, PTH1 family|nr:aminoacyl-tRNA hydrolase [Nitrospirota bacterium]
MWVIAGLGNPGRKYLRTRHNIGFMVIEKIAIKNNIDFQDKKGYRIGRGSIGGNDILLVEPLLYMNMSGHVIKNILMKFDIKPENLIVIHDDLDMIEGKLRIKKTGSSGGHKGIESIIQNIGSKDFIRLKIGIGREEDILPEEYVLRKFKREEMTVIKDTIQKAADALESIVSEGVDKAMNRFN